MSKTLKGFVLGALITSIITFSIPSLAAGLTKNIKATFNAVTVKINGKTIFGDRISYGGNVYVNTKSVSQILGKDYTVDKNGNINLVSKLTTQPRITPVPLASPIPDSSQEIKTYKLNETASFDGLEVTVSRVENNKGFKIYFEVINNSQKSIQNAGEFSFKLSDNKYEEEVNRSAFGLFVSNTGYIYPGESSNGYYYLPYSKDIVITEITYYFPDGGAHLFPLGKWKLE